MLIALIGPTCSGKTSVADYLVRSMGWTRASVGGGDDRHGLVADETTTRLHFQHARQLLDYATAHWMQDLVTTDVKTRDEIKAMAKRPFFLLVAVEAPVLTRWARQRERQERQRETEGQATPSPLDSLLRFVEASDKELYEPDLTTTVTTASPATTIQSLHANGLQPPGRPSRAPSCPPSPTLAPTTHSLSHLTRLASVTIANTFDDLASLHRLVARLELDSRDRLRPSWDTYFMRLADLASRRSNCMKRRVGAVLVSQAEMRVLSTGYNGTPRGILNCNMGGCPRCNRGVQGGLALDECLCMHAEENALLEAGRERIGKGAVLYCNTCPCLRCATKIVQTGVKEVVYNQSYSMDKASFDLLARANVILRKLEMPA